MTYQGESNIELIKQTNAEMRSYFHGEYMIRQEKEQKHKTDLFELNIKIEELEKTRELYLFKNDDRRNLFTPIPVESSGENQKGKAIDVQLGALREKRFQLQTMISGLEMEKKSFEELIEAIDASTKAIEEIVNEDAKEGTSQTEGFEYVQNDKKNKMNNGLLILMHQEMQMKKMTASLDTHVKKLLLKDSEQVSWMSAHENQKEVKDEELIKKIDEIKDNNRQALSNLSYILKHYHQTFDGHLPGWKVIEDKIATYKRMHPDAIVDGKVEKEDVEMKIHPMYTLFLVKTLDELVQNAFKHGKANKVLIKVSFEKDKIRLYLSDNGVGIKAADFDGSKWYSGLHNIKDNVELLQGKFQYEGSLAGGTKIEISIPM